jgi:hypothetical protein
MMIAEATTEPNAMQFGIWILCAFVAVNGLATFILLVKFFRNDAERRDITINSEAATKDEFTAHVSRNQLEHDQLHTKISGSEKGTRGHISEQIAELRAERRHDMDQLNNSVHTLSKDVGRVLAQNDLQNQRLAQIDAKIDRKIEREKGS